MKRFVQLFQELDQTTSINAKVNALKAYFAVADPEDALWTIALLSHRRPKRTVNTTQMKSWVGEASGIPFWLIDETHHIVGDLAETMAKVFPKPGTGSEHSLTYWINEIRNLGDLAEEEKKKRLIEIWLTLGAEERFVFNKIITGGFRMGVSQKLMTRALSAHTGIEEHVIAHRLMGDWTPDTATFESLVLNRDDNPSLSRPYPFYLSYSLEGGIQELGDPADWNAEYKWDGIRGQIILRAGQVFTWSRGEELVTDKYPEYEILADVLPDGTVLDGEILPYKDGAILPFQSLQTRIGRKNVSASLLKKTPVVFRAYDVLEYDNRDIRNWSLHKRRELLRSLVPDENDVLQYSASIAFDSWEELAELRLKARARQSEGLMLKLKNSPYGVGRKKGEWWKWKVDPLTVDAVMIYAMRGHGRRATLYTDYTFAVWDGEQLVPFTKAYSGLNDKEILEVDRFVKSNTIDRFGPVRSVEPTLVFEIAFEGIQRSTRHKSGVALRFPRIRRWRKDKPASEANTLNDLTALLREYEDL